MSGNSLTTGPDIYLTAPENVVMLGDGQKEKPMCRQDRCENFKQCTVVRRAKKQLTMLIPQSTVRIKPQLPAALLTFLGGSVGWPKYLSPYQPLGNLG